jgi:2-dehydropantoate 2-reductase
VGCVVDAPGETIEPGVVVARNVICKFTLGEPDGSESERVTAIADTMNGAGLVAEVSPRIREEVWKKLFGNMILAPVAALTRATAGELFADADLMAICRQAMEEGQLVANEFGESFDLDFEKRLAIGGGNPAHKQSMLQDAEKGRPMEVDALVTIVCELGRMVGVETPVMDMVLALVKQQARVLGLYRG